MATISTAYYCRIPILAARVIIRPRVAARRPRATRPLSTSLQGERFQPWSLVGQYPGPELAGLPPSVRKVLSYTCGAEQYAFPAIVNLFRVICDQPVLGELLNERQDLLTRLLGHISSIPAQSTQHLVD